jgi:enterochelin esterase-like enzyme
MKPNCLLGALLLASLVLEAVAQAPAAAPGTPATPPPAERRGVRPAPVRSPEVLADGKVTFRLRAPKAAEVVVAGQWRNGRAPMTKDTNEVWSVTVGPIEPGVWEYSFQVDGLGMIDPGNPAIKPMREPRTSILHLPANPPRPHDFQDVPHGTVRLHTYHSKSLDRVRDLAVYTPPRYDQEPGNRYPVLYLQHGAGDNQATWTVHGKAHWILDSLIAAGRARPMILVMMDGHAATGGGGAAPQNNTALFERDLLEDVLPFIESNYRVLTDPASRGIVGLSMGGGQSLTIGLNHADRFAWVGGFSSAVPATATVAGALDDAEATNQRLKLLWIACGRDDFLLRRNEDFVVLLKEKAVRHEWRLTDGDHSWPVWRGYLAEFLPRLFQP